CAKAGISRRTATTSPACANGVDTEPRVDAKLRSADGMTLQAASAGEATPVAAPSATRAKTAADSMILREAGGLDSPMCDIPPLDGALLRPPGIEVLRGYLPGRVPAGPSLAADRWHGARAVEPLPASQPFSDAASSRATLLRCSAAQRGAAGCARGVPGDAARTGRPRQGLALKTARDISDGTLLPAERPPELPARLHSH